MSQEDRDRYLAAAHAMQSGVAMTMNYDPDDTNPKHLRVGVNSGLVNSSALARLLIDKEIITIDEYDKYLADLMEEEAARYTQEINQHFHGTPDGNISLG